mmetsp:Transcript_19805/g.78896  ORF Transcript_19805/g.78896 Transcript_19805/m.78896 type:complete len:203 (-) Transcript_19805:1357-1965(-)
MRTSSLFLHDTVPARRSNAAEPSFSSTRSDESRTVASSSVVISSVALGNEDDDSRSQSTRYHRQHRSAVQAFRGAATSSWCTRSCALTAPSARSSTVACGAPSLVHDRSTAGRRHAMCKSSSQQVRPSTSTATRRGAPIVVSRRTRLASTRTLLVLLLASTTRAPLKKTRRASLRRSRATSAASSPHAGVVTTTPSRRTSQS